MNIVDLPQAIIGPWLLEWSWFFGVPTGVTILGLKGTRFPLARPCTSHNPMKRACQMQRIYKTIFARPGRMDKGEALHNLKSLIAAFKFNFLQDAF